MDDPEENKAMKEERPFAALCGGSKDLRAIRKSFEDMPVTEESEQLGVRMIARDFFVYAQKKLAELYEMGDGGAGMKRNIFDFMHDLDAKLDMHKSSFLPKDDGGLDLRGAGTKRLQKEAASLDDAGLLDFSAAVANMPGRKLSGLTTIGEWMDNARELVKDDLSRALQEYREEGYTDSTRNYYQYYTEGCIGYLDCRLEYVIPASPPPTAEKPKL